MHADATKISVEQNTSVDSQRKKKKQNKIRLLLFNFCFLNVPLNYLYDNKFAYWENRNKNNKHLMQHTNINLLYEGYRLNTAEYSKDESRR